VVHKHLKSTLEYEDEIIKKENEEKVAQEKSKLNAEL